MKRFIRRLLRSIRKRMPGCRTGYYGTAISRKTDLPLWAIDELKELSVIEPDLYPSQEFLERYSLYETPVQTAPGEVYGDCLQTIGSLQPDIIVLVPWLMRGGADLGALHHVRATMSLGKTVLVIATLAADSPWKDRIPEGVCFLELGLIGKALSEEHRLLVLARLVLQSPAAVVHIINSQLGWEMVKRYGKALVTSEKKLFASVYCDDVDRHNVRWSYPRFYFPSCYHFLNGIICDSVWYPLSLQRQFGVSSSKISTVYFPAVVLSGKTYRSANVPRIMWAGRLTLQKRPDLLIAVARMLPDVAFDVWGYAYGRDGKKYRQELEKLPNVQLCGSYDSFESLTTQQSYALLLYTSAWDGLPNVLLEAVACGLPVVASAVCGIPEFISEATGYPVVDWENPQAYVDAIGEALGDPKGRRERWERAFELLGERHCMDRFIAEMQLLDGYFN